MYKFYTDAARGLIENEKMLIIKWLKQASLSFLPSFCDKKLFEQAVSRTISRERLTIQAAKLQKTLYIP